MPRVVPILVPRVVPACRNRNRFGKAAIGCAAALSLLLAGVGTQGTVRAGADDAAPPNAASNTGAKVAARERTADVDIGFAARDITPEIREDRPVWLAGYGNGRRATGVHDPLWVRAVVLRDGERKIALASVDLVGLQRAEVLRVREQLKDFSYVLVASTHNHEGPDVIGIWGRTPFRRGVDDAYLSRVVDETVAAILEADKQARPMSAAYGMADDESLLGDSRLPHVKDGVIRALRFQRAGTSGESRKDADRNAPSEESNREKPNREPNGERNPAGLLVQWNCHPEALGSRNTLLTADFPATTIERLAARFQAPVAYFSGAVGGLMAPPGGGRVRDDAGNALDDGNFEYARRYGELTADLAARAIDGAKPIRLTPFRIAERTVAIPLTNQHYKAAREIGVLRRDAVEWTGDGERPGPPIGRDNADAEKAAITEVAVLQLGELTIFALPGELYPELVYGRVQTPADPGADFPDSPAEPSIASISPTDRWLLFGLANDEIGYIIPRRQWDERAPFCYGRTKSQYGEINSCGPDVAPIVMAAIAKCAKDLAPRP